MMGSAIETKGRNIDIETKSMVSWKPGKKVLQEREHH